MTVSPGGVSRDASPFECRTIPGTPHQGRLYRLAGWGSGWEAAADSGIFRQLTR